MNMNKVMVNNSKSNQTGNNKDGGSIFSRTFEQLFDSLKSTFKFNNDQPQVRIISRQNLHEESNNDVKLVNEPVLTSTFANTKVKPIKQRSSSHHSKVNKQTTSTGRKSKSKFPLKEYDRSSSSKMTNMESIVKDEQDSFSLYENSVVDVSMNSVLADTDLAWHGRRISHHDFCQKPNERNNRRLSQIMEENSPTQRARNSSLFARRQTLLSSNNVESAMRLPRKTLIQQFQKKYMAFDDNYSDSSKKSPSNNSSCLQDVIQPKHDMLIKCTTQTRKDNTNHCCSHGQKKHCNYKSCNAKSNYYSETQEDSEPETNIAIEHVYEENDSKCNSKSNISNLIFNLPNKTIDVDTKRKLPINALLPRPTIVNDSNDLTLHTTHKSSTLRKQAV